MSWLEDEFGTARPLIGVVHLLPLPGSPLYRGRLEEVFTEGRRCGLTFFEAGFDGVCIENFGDVPFQPGTVEPHVVAIVSALLSDLSKKGTCGVNLLRNASRQAIGASVGGGGAFIRVNVHTGCAVTDQGIIEGKAHETLRYRRSLGPEADRVRILCDCQVKHAAPLVAGDPVSEGKDCVERGLADALIVTGPRTGEEGDLDQVVRLKKALPETPVLMGSGVNEHNVGRMLGEADGVIVSSSLESELGRIDPAKVEDFVRAARRR